MYNIRIKKKAEKELSKLPGSVILKVVQSIKSLAEDPRPSGCKKLKGSELWRIRIGDYRVIYAIDDAIKIVEIERIRHRKDVYTL